MSRIAIIADPIDNQYGGVHTYTAEMVKALVQYDERNKYIVLRQKDSKDFPSIEQYVVPNHRSILGYQSLRLFVIIPHLLRRLDVDVVVEPAHFGPFNLPAGVARVTVIHDLTPIHFPHFHKFHSQLLQKIFLGRIIDRADVIISNSDSTSRDIGETYGCSRHKIRKLYPGREEWIRRSEDREIWRRYDLPMKYFLFVGTIEPRKNLPCLLRAYRGFREETEYEYGLIIVGQVGWKSTGFTRELASHPYRKDIRMLGYVARNELPALYSFADAMIYPSTYEGFGLPILEAMSCATPCIISDNSSLPEVGGDAVLYFASDDDHALRGQMVRIASDEKLRSNLSCKALGRSRFFSWERYARGFAEIMAELNGKSGPV